MSDVYVVDALRTPIGTAGSAFAGVDAAHLAAPVLASLRERLEGRRVGDVVLGNCMGPGGNIARVAALTAALPDDTPALSVDRQCASGLSAIEVGASLVRDSSFVLAGGVESASTAPLRYRTPAPGGEPEHYHRAPFAPEGRDPEMGVAADALAAAFGISRSRQDEYAARSHERAHAAQQAGRFESEIVPVAGHERDQRIRGGLTVERLAKLPPAFGPAGTATAGNSCGINDGAAAVTITRSRRAERGLKILAVASVGNDPTVPGLGLVGAVRAALHSAGRTNRDIEVWEFNEAFAGQVLACADALGLPDHHLCADGGALALGHPWGASGAVIAVRLFTQMITQGRGRYGVAAIAAGGGQGTAIVVQACR